MDLTRSLLERAPFEFIDHAQAKDAWAYFRSTHGAALLAPPLLTAPNDNYKFRKTSAAVYGLSLAQADTSGVNVCRFSTPECRRGCVSYAGKGEMATVQAGRVRRTQFLNEQPEAFLTLLVHEIQRAWRKHGTELRVRLNTFSDIPWERVCPDLFDANPGVPFYDYTKWTTRGHPFGGTYGKLPKNYPLVHSVSEKTADDTIGYRSRLGLTQAVVFKATKSQPLPIAWHGMHVIDGDMSDDRSADPRGVIVGLRATGRMRKGVWGMSREVA